MRKKIIAILMAVMLVGTFVPGCAGQGSTEETNTEETNTEEAASEEETEEEAEETEKAAEETEEGTEKAEAELEDGIYIAEFHTDSGMFHVNEAEEGKGTLTVQDGEMVIHISLVSKNIINLYPGLAEDAQEDGAELLMPTEDTVTYSDGTSEEVYGFDIPVPALDEEFDLAILGTKGTWYDHKVSVSNPELLEE